MVKLAVFRSVKYEYNYESVREVNENDEPEYGEESSIRVSEIIEVDFPPRDSKEVLNGEIAILDKQVTRVQADATAAITALTRRKQELLAIGYDGGSNGETEESTD